LHAIPGKEEQTYITILQHELKVLERTVHVSTRTVHFLDGGETAGLKLAANIFSIIYWILQGV
jgi:hypothetical protein